MPGLWLHRFTLILAACTLFLVVAGASVVSKEAGLSVPDWPLSYGQVMPPMVGGVFYEHGHRMVGATVGFLTVMLAVWLWLKDDRKWMKYWGLIALAAVIVQGVLGGLTVRYLLPKAISISHASLAQMFFALTVAFVVFTSTGWRRGAAEVRDAGWPSLRSLAVITPLAILVQLGLGAAFRHKAIGVLPHVLWALAVTLFVMMVTVFTLTQYKDHRPLRKASIALLSTTLAQVLLGVGAYVARLTDADSLTPGNLMVAVTVAHVGLGALVLGLSTAQSILVLRYVRPALPATQPAGHELASPGRTF
jgi:cytochrome c oxidase assembly protein subunit 15